jgi:hypothetical protein
VSSRLNGKLYAMDSHSTSAEQPRLPLNGHNSIDNGKSALHTLSSPDSGQIRPSLKQSDLLKNNGELLGNGASSLNRGAMDQWLQQNATTFSPAGYRAQLQPKIQLPLQPHAVDARTVRFSLPALFPLLT